MNILVTGGTGFIGKHLVKELITNSHNLLLYVRNKEKAFKLFGDKVEYVVGDITDKKLINENLANIDVVYHIAGQIGEWGITKEFYTKINVDFTKLILNESINNQVNQFIFCSSGGVLGPLPDGVPADETFPYNPSNYYESSKTEAEQYVLSKKDKVHITILRPEFIFGEGDLHVLGLFQQIKKGYFPIFGNGKTLLHPTYIQDVINAFLLVLNNPKCYGEVFIVSGEKPYTVVDLIKIIEKVMNTKTTKIFIPEKIGMLTALIVEKLAKLLKIQPPLTISMVKFFSENRYYPSKKIQKLGLKLTPIEKGLKNTIKFYKDNGLL